MVIDTSKGQIKSTISDIFIKWNQTLNSNTKQEIIKSQESISLIIFKMFTYFEMDSVSKKYIMVKK